MLTNSLTPTSIGVLKKQVTVMLHKLPEEKVRRSKEKIKQSFNGRKLKPDEIELFNQLRTKRKQIADNEHVPPYVIFADTTLFDLTTKKPQSLEDFSHIFGVGRYKLEKYGNQFLEILKKYEWCVRRDATYCVSTMWLYFYL